MYSTSTVARWQFYDSVVSVGIQAPRPALQEQQERDRSLAITFEYRFHFDAAIRRTVVVLLNLSFLGPRSSKRDV